MVYFIVYPTWFPSPKKLKFCRRWVVALQRRLVLFSVERVGSSTLWPWRASWKPPTTRCAMDPWERSKCLSWRENRGFLGEVVHKRWMLVSRWGLNSYEFWNNMFNMFNTCESKVSGTIGTIPIDKTFKCPQSRKANLSMESIVWSDTICCPGVSESLNDKTLDALCVRWDPHQEHFGCYPNQTLLALSLCLEFFVWQSRFCCSQSMIDPHVHHFMISWSASGVGTRLVPGLPFFRPRRRTTTATAIIREQQ